ncbi:glucose PTS transporter subunit EIIB [Clostridioides difficile]|nr:glucose PTS transporter subunit EIIB [Clostridioides difficile]
MMMHILGVAIGNTQGGIIDLVVFGVMQPNTKWIYSIMLGLVYALVYYNVFKILILRFNLQTPGREEIADINFDLEPLSNKVEIAQSGETTKRALSIIKYLGGKDNIEDITNCITRLRVVVKDMSKVDENALKKYTGAMGVIKVSDKDIQIIYGPSVSQVRDEVSFAMSI